MRTILTGLLLAALLLLAACEGETDTAGTDDETDDQTAAETNGGDAGEDATGEGADLPEGVAATVDGEEIPAQEVDDRFAAAEGDEQFAEALEGEEGEQVAAQFRAQTLSILLQTRIVLDGAEELDATPTEEDLERTREELVTELGGQEQFDEAIAGSGMSEDAFEEQLRGVAALDVVGRTLVEQGEVPEPPEGAEDIDPEQLAVQQWLAEQFGAADVVVDPDYGTWNAQAGQVMPAGMEQPPVMEQPPAEATTPEE